MGQREVLHNNQGKGFEDWTEKAGFAAAGTGWWTSIAAADFNGDGRPDYVVGNVGLNTQYHADPAHPALLFSGDFKGDGSTQLMEACYEGDLLYPWRNRRDVGVAIPSVLKRYTRSDYYAQATLGQILGEDKLAAAVRFAATELRSGVFLSQPTAPIDSSSYPELRRFRRCKAWSRAILTATVAPTSMRCRIPTRPFPRSVVSTAASVSCCRRRPWAFHAGAGGRKRPAGARRRQGACGAGS